jgi:hypothetical protein
MYRASLSGSALLAAWLASGSASAAAGDEFPHLDERTALMLGAKRLKLGILSFDYGISERISIGTDPPPWVARAFLPVLIPNLHLKLSILERGPVSLAVQGAGYFIGLNEELTNNWIRAYGAGDLHAAGIGGQVAARAALDPYTTVNIGGRAKPRVEHPWQVVGGVAFLWRHFHLIVGVGVGVGYGYYFVPGIDIPYPHRGFVPDGSLSFVL